MVINRKLVTSIPQKIGYLTHCPIKLKCKKAVINKYATNHQVKNVQNSSVIFISLSTGDNFEQCIDKTVIGLKL
jgi:hypothetical protein